MGRTCLKPKESDFELQREQRIAENNARLAALGVLDSSSTITKSFKAKKAQIAPAKSKRKNISIFATPPERKSRRLLGSAPEYAELVEDPLCDATEVGLLRLPLAGLGIDSEAKLERLEEVRTSAKQSRSTVYDKELGITCHFCRQKTLCKEPDCPRCSKRNTEEACIGKSECQKCHSATGQFCRACLRLRYGMDLHEVKKQEAAGQWMCPHCYEAEHPEEGWICNSSICMTRRGLKPTGIAIHKARELGFVSVAHLVKAQLLKHKSAGGQK